MLRFVTRLGLGVLLLLWLGAGVAALAMSAAAGICVLVSLLVYVAGEIWLNPRDARPSLALAWLVIHRLALGAGVIILALTNSDSDLGTAIGVVLGCLIGFFPVSVIAVAWLVSRRSGHGTSPPAE
jgi:hypothetical protein